MRLTVIGCAGSYPGPDSAASCYLLEAEHEARTWRVLLDIGSGSLGPLHHAVDPLRLDGGFVTHLHPDHYSDISGHYVLRRYHPDGPQPRIPLWGPPGMQDQTARAYGLALDPGMTNEFVFHEYGEEPVQFGPFTVHTTRVKHPVTAYSLRIAADGRVLVYSGDTGPCEALVEHAKKADLLLCEAAFVSTRDNPVDLHMTGRDAGSVAAAAEVGQLVLTHIPAWNDRQAVLGEARAVYDGPIELAAVMATYEL